MKNEDEVHKLLSRSILLKSAYSFMYSADSYNSLHDQIRHRHGDFEVFDTPSQSFCVKVRPIGRKKGINCMKIAEVIFYCCNNRLRMIVFVAPRATAENLSAKALKSMIK
ncbi:hypothetical protein ANCCAN_02136 [Ancylostoma caninum]|uniref:Uncharacterized protein n=1 Tax=Ancylostoma caninum TaxID=29170 RepID=A0A368H5A2_ANCCA|nr:hypothetical protein ANCCAN_02136 [Ancylostoma caninum]